MVADPVAPLLEGSFGGLKRTAAAPRPRPTTEETVLAIAEHLPGEAAEAVLELAVGGTPRKPEPVAASQTPFEHPDAKRRFKVVTTPEELEQALAYPWEKWTIFLHPDQRALVEREYGGAFRVSGSAGTGKTIVALHRAVFLAKKYFSSRVVLVIFSTALANALQTKLRRLLAGKPKLGERIELSSINELGVRLYKSHIGPVTIADAKTVESLIVEAASNLKGQNFDKAFFLAEWSHVVDTWQLKTWESYRDVTRLGRRVRLPESRRQVLWNIFASVLKELDRRKLKTLPAIFIELADALKRTKHPPYEFAVIDECQDIDVGQLKMMATLGGNRPNGLIFTGDTGQRIFQQPFSWKSLGLDLRGKSKTLRVNYRTSHQIRTHADRLLEREISDTDGNVEKRSDTISVFNGIKPDIVICDDEQKENAVVANWLTELAKLGVLPHECAVFVRSADQLPRALKAVNAAHLPFKVLDDQVETVVDKISICTMHLAKGLEFRAVVVMACDDQVSASHHLNVDRDVADEHASDGPTVTILLFHFNRYRVAEDESG